MHRFAVATALSLLSLTLYSAGFAERAVAGGRVVSVRLTVRPRCIVVGGHVRLTMHLTGVRPYEQVYFSGSPTKPGFGGGDFGRRRANGAGTIRFTYPGARFQWEAGTWVVQAYRHTGHPPYDGISGRSWLAASTTYRVVRREKSCPR